MTPELVFSPLPMAHARTQYTRTSYTRKIFLKRRELEWIILIPGNKQTFWVKQFFCLDLYLTCSETSRNHLFFATSICSSLSHPTSHNCHNQTKSALYKFYVFTNISILNSICPTPLCGTSRFYLLTFSVIVKIM